jgi:SAM-dependent methyltransferase
MASSASDGAVPSPNIWHHTDVYEVENRSVDPAGNIESAMRDIYDWSGRDVLDLGCGTGFHLPRWAYDAGSVTGVEPHHALAAIAARRTSRIGNVKVVVGSAQDLPLPDASVDMMQARWAYFFGPGCEPGLAEVDRVMREGGIAFVIDNDATRSTFGGWFRRGWPQIDPGEVERFWSTRGWTRRPVDIVWRFQNRDDLEAVVRIEFTPALADELIGEHTGLEVDYAVNLWWRRY